MRAVVLSIGFMGMVIGVAGLISPAAVTAVMASRRRRVTTRRGLYITPMFRMIAGLLLILFAPESRMPVALRVVGGLVCIQGPVQGLGRWFLATERMHAMLDWEEARPGLLRIGAMIALAFGGFLAYAAMPQ